MRRPFMKVLARKVEAAITAAAFAEEGEVETARRIMAQADMDEDEAGGR